jgi:hypothetical protein
MSEDGLGTPVSHVTRVTFGGAELPGAVVWARPDYSTDEGHVTVQFQSQGPRWQAGTSAMLVVTRSGGQIHELPVRVEQEVWHGEEHRTAQLRLKIAGAEPWAGAEELLAS